MKEEEIVELFEKYNDEYLKFDKIPIEDRFSNSPDLCAFNFIYNKLLKEDDINKNIVEASEHDKIHLTNIDENKITEKDVIYLTRCGVFYDEEFGSLCMFV